MSLTPLEELPPPGPEPVWSDFAQLCREQPGWHHLGRMARSTAWHIQTGRYAAFRPAGAFLARVRNTEAGRGDVYVSFRGKRRVR